MILIFCFVLLILLFVFPFIPGIQELRKKEDPAPLFVDLNYYRNPRYFAISFRNILSESLNKQKNNEGICTLILSKPETVEIIEEAIIQDNYIQNNIFYVKKNITTGKNVILKKEIFAKGSAFIGENNFLRALTCDGNIEVLKGTKFLRWVDAEGNINIGEDCDLGISVSCNGKLSLSRNVSFRRLYGFPVITYLITDDYQGEEMFTSEAAAVLSNEKYSTTLNETIVFEGESIERNIPDISPYSHKDCSIINQKSLVIGACSTIRGHVKTHGNLIVEDGVIITGNIFAEGTISIGSNSCILGSVFTQDVVVINNGVTIGSRGKIKSVIGKKGIVLHNNVIIYGYLMTEGVGTIS